MIAAYATLLARSFKIEIPYKNPRSAEAKSEMAEQAAKIKVAEFVPDDKKAAQI